MSTFGPRVALFLTIAFCLPTITSAAKSELQWQTGKLVSFETQDGTTHGTYQSQVYSPTNNTAPPATVTNLSESKYVDCQVVIDDGKILYFGSERLVFRWEHTPHFTENETVKFALNGDKLTVIDDAGKTIKLKLIKRRIKE